MSEYRSFAICGIKITNVPGENQSSPARLRQYAEFLNAKRIAAGENHYSVYLGNDCLDYDENIVINKKAQADNTAIYVGINVQFSQIYKFPDVINHVIKQPFLNTTIEERRIYSGLTNIDL